MGIKNLLDSTARLFFGIGEGVTKILLKNNAGVLEARNHDDSAYVDFKANSLSAPNIDPLQQNIGVFLDEFQVIAGPGVFQSVPQAGHPYGYYFYQLPVADGDAIEASVFLPEGTYDFEVLGITENNCGIIDWTLDGAPLVTGQDWYSLATVLDVRMNTAGIAIANAKEYKLRGTINGQNAASTNYYFRLTKATFRRTGP